MVTIVENKPLEIQTPLEQIKASAISVLALVVAADGSVSDDELGALKEALNSTPGFITALQFESVDEISGKVNQQAQAILANNDSYFLSVLNSIGNCSKSRFRAMSQDLGGELANDLANDLAEMIPSAILKVSCKVANVGEVTEDEAEILWNLSQILEVSLVEDKQAEKMA